MTDDSFHYQYRECYATSIMKQKRSGIADLRQGESVPDS